MRDAARDTAMVGLPPILQQSVYNGLYGPEPFGIRGVEVRAFQPSDDCQHLRDWVASLYCDLRQLPIWS